MYPINQIVQPRDLKTFGRVQGVVVDHYCDTNVVKVRYGNISGLSWIDPDWIRHYCWSDDECTPLEW